MLKNSISWSCGKILSCKRDISELLGNRAEKRAEPVEVWVEPEGLKLMYCCLFKNPVFATSKEL